VDPVTHLLQGELRDEDPWVRLTDFGRADAVGPGEYATGRAREEFIGEVVTFQLEQGATAVIPPYPYVSATDDPWFAVAVGWIEATRAYLDRNGIALPILPVLCGQLRSLSTEGSWVSGLDDFARAASGAGAEAIGLCLSPVGDGFDSYDKLMRLFRTAERVKDVSGGRVLAWRQGIYGHALVAAGLDGYETGIGTSEQSNVRANIASRKPPPSGKASAGRSFSGIYLEPLGRSLPRRVAQLLLANVSMRAKVMCTDERCCPRGVASTIDQHREHAVRSRARELDTLAALPARAWRLNHVAMKAQAAHTLAIQANSLLKEVGDPNTVHERGYESLQRVTEELRQADAEGATGVGGGQ
jgi:hypothetical protein